MLVRLKQAATVFLEHIGLHWHAAGSEVEIPADHFDPAVHEDLTPPADPGAPADGVPAEPEKADG